MNLLNTAKREYYTIKQSISQSIKKETNNGYHSSNSLQNLPEDDFEKFVCTVNNLPNFVNTVHCSLKNLQTEFYRRSALEAEISTLISNEITQLTDETEEQVNESSSNSDKDEGGSESDDIDLLVHASAPPPVDTTTTSIPLWLDDKRKTELNNLPTRQQTLLSKITLLRNSSISALNTLINSTHTERTRYHAMLNWMHDSSCSLNPEDAQQLSNFRQVQGEVRSQKLRFEDKMQELGRFIRFTEGEIDEFMKDHFFEKLCGDCTGSFCPLEAEVVEVLNFEGVNAVCIKLSGGGD